MADFNLMPVPKVLIVQVGIFIANTFVVKKLVLDPYRRLKERRKALTERRQQQAQQRIQELTAKLEALRAQRQQKLSELAAWRRQQQEQDQQQRMQALQEAHAKSETKISAKKKAIKKEFDQEFANSINAVDYLSEQIVAKILQRTS